MDWFYYKLNNSTDTFLQLIAEIPFFNAHVMCDIIAIYPKLKVIEGQTRSYSI